MSVGLGLPSSLDIDRGAGPERSAMRTFAEGLPVSSGVRAALGVLAQGTVDLGLMPGPHDVSGELDCGPVEVAKRA